MKPSELERKLIAAAKAHAPSEAVPYAFEQRIMARLGSAPVLDAWADWGRALWRAAAPCVVIAVLLGIWSAVHEAGTPSSDLSQDFEQTVFAAVTHDSDAN
jgi:hypothetical protein